MITLDTIQSWQDSGIALAFVDLDRLRVTGPLYRMTPDLQATISANKVEIIRLLSTDILENLASGYDCWTDADLIELWQERSAIMEHDGGLTTKNADEVSKQWFINLIGEKRFSRIADNERSAPKSTNDTPENIGHHNNQAGLMERSGLQNSGGQVLGTPTRLITSLIRSEATNG